MTNGPLPIGSIRPVAATAGAWAYDGVAQLNGNFAEDGDLVFAHACRLGAGRSRDKIG
jgi:hypothetical protein